MGALGVFFPSEYDGKTGIYMLDPYEPGKIPVVFVHGLMSSPEAWTNAMNDLRGNPELRKRYQFWMFFYSTGNPLLASGARFRKALNEMRTSWTRGGKTQRSTAWSWSGTAWGACSRNWPSARAARRSGTRPPRSARPDRNGSPDQRLAHGGHVLRACTHRQTRGLHLHAARGSPLGDELVGRVTSRLIRVPADILQIRETLAQANGQAKVSEAFRGTRYATGVAQLGVGNPVLQAINQLPMSADVPYHSIVGYNGKEPLPKGGDGVVPYKSAHIEERSPSWSSRATTRPRKPTTRFVK